MLTGGMTPFEGHVMEMVSARTTRDAPRISDRAPELTIPPALDDVAGSLPAGAVQRAIERRWSAIERCVPSAPETVVARFTIGEARRARDVRAAAPTAETNACVAAALTDVRTEAARPTSAMSRSPSGSRSW